MKKNVTLYRRNKSIPDSWEISNLFDLLNIAVETYDEKAAVRERGAKQEVLEYSYRKLRDDAVALAVAMKKDFDENEHVILIGESSYEWLLAYFATVISGKVIVPLDRNISKDVLEKLIGRLHPGTVFCSSACSKHIKKLVSGNAHTTIYMNLEDRTISNSVFGKVDAGYWEIKKGGCKFESGIKDPNQLASIIFTSGTTGANKGVLQTHKNICTNIYGIKKQFHKQEWEMLSVLPIHHSFELHCNILPAIAMGNTIHFCTNMKYFIKDIVQFHIDRLCIVPAMMEVLYQHREVCKGREFLVICAGAAPDKPFIKKLIDGGIEVVLGYGLTEASPLVTGILLDGNFSSLAGNIIDYVSVKIDDPDENGVGEILLKGDNIFPGYYEDEAATKCSFTEDGWFKTGDLGYIEDEKLLLTGRKKNTIILKNGENVQPEELEAAIIEATNAADEVIVCEMPVVISGEVKNVIGAIVHVVDECSGDNICRIKEAIEQLNDKVEEYKQINCFCISKKPFERNHLKKIVRKNEIERARKLEKVTVL